MLERKLRKKSCSSFCWMSDRFIWQVIGVIRRKTVRTWAQTNASAGPPPGWELRRSISGHFASHFALYLSLHSRAEVFPAIPTFCNPIPRLVGNTTLIGLARVGGGREQIKGLVRRPRPSRDVHHGQWRGRQDVTGIVNWVFAISARTPEIEGFGVRGWGRERAKLHTRLHCQRNAERTDR